MGGVIATTSRTLVGVMLQIFFIASIYGWIILDQGQKCALEKYKVFRILNHPDMLSIKVHETIGSCELLHADLWSMSSSDHQNLAEALLDFCKCIMLSSLPKLCKARTLCPDLGSTLAVCSAKRREHEDARKRKDIRLFFWSRLLNSCCRRW